MHARNLNRLTASSGVVLVFLSATFGIGCRRAPAPSSGPPPAVLTKKTDTVLQGPRTTIAPRFALQVGAFDKKGDADELAFRLSTRYQETVVVAPTKMGDRELYRVRILVETQADANALALRLSRDEKLKTWVVEFP